jgi:hypothetical protein
MRHIVKCIVLAALTLLLAALAQAQSGQTLYGIVSGMSGAVLVKIDPQTGLRTDLVQLSPYWAVSGLALSPAGMVYTTTTDAFLPSPRLLRVDPVAGTVALVGSANYTLSVSALAFDPSGRLLGISFQNRMVQIDPDTGAALALGQVSGMSPTEHVEDMAFDSSGTLYAVTYDPGSGPGMPPSPPWPIRIIRIDTSTLQAADVAILTPPIYLTGLAIDMAGQVWGAACPASAAIVKVDPATGGWTTTAPVNPTVSCVHDLAFTPAPADTTPPTIVPLIAGPIGNAGWYRGSVSLSWTVSDPESVFTTAGCEPVLLTTDTTGATFTCTATSAGGTASKSVTIRIDKTPPTISCTATPNTLWPPDRKLFPVTVSVNVTDGLSGSAGFVLVSVGAVPELEVGDVQGFTPGMASTTGQLRAVKGRTYSLVYSGKDIAGNIASCTATVIVPHDQGNR